MPPKFIHGLRACCVAVAVLLATAHAAEPKEAPSPIGLTRDQVISRYGEPRSQIVAGNRLIMFFARERLVLRDGVVIEIERLAAEPARKTAPAPAAAADATETPPAATPPVERTGAAGAVPPTSTSAAPPAGTPVETLDPAAPAPAPAQPAAPAGEAKLEIKSVRPPSGDYSRPTPAPTKSVTTSAPPATVRPTTTPATKSAPVPAPRATTPAPAPTKSSVATTPAATAPATTPPVNQEVYRPPAVRTPSATTTIAPLPAPAEPTEAPKTEAETKAELAAAEKKAKDEKLRSVRARRRIEEAGDPDAPEFTEAFYTTRTFVIAVIVVGAGLMYLIWRNRQRQLLLDATAVTHSPFGGASAEVGDAGATFTSDLLSKLEWKKFEELVADYYAKTGVVATRTKTGPASPVHIRISWKGEPRPFACVQCIAHPPGLVDAKPLQDLMGVLAAEDIRRGYVVTSGKFSVPARDFAEEKHLTLMPGDIFLEKLNALPDAARNEIMQALTTGDYQTPSCPKCEARMVKSPDNPNQWRCAAHPDQVIPVWR